jgi:hypothetical protein
MRSVIFVLLLFVLSNAQADTSEEGLEVQCNQWQMRVRDFDFTNGVPDKQQNVTTVVYRDDKPHKVSCVVNNHNVEVNFQVIGGSKCGTGSLVTLKIDGQLIVKDAQIHGCTVGTTEIGVMPGLDNDGGYHLEICGYTPRFQTPSFNGCVMVTAKQLESIKKPLNQFFPVGDLIKLVKFPS